MMQMITSRHLALEKYFLEDAFEAQIFRGIWHY